VLRRHVRFTVAMTLGSVAGSLGGGLLLDVAPPAVLVPGLAALLLASSAGLWRHDGACDGGTSGRADAADHA
jgi:hypothetical protein